MHVCMHVYTGQAWSTAMVDIIAGLASLALGVITRRIIDTGPNLRRDGPSGTATTHQSRIALLKIIASRPGESLPGHPGAGSGWCAQIDPPISGCTSRCHGSPAMVNRHLRVHISSSIDRCILHKYLPGSGHPSPLHLWIRSLPTFSLRIGAARIVFCKTSNSLKDHHQSHQIRFSVNSLLNFKEFFRL